MAVSSSSLYAVVLAGGSGTRFWPASRSARPKQLLALGPAQDRSLIRATVERLAALTGKERIFVSTGEQLVAATRRELPELEESAFLAEPEAKNTAPCIGWAAAVVARGDPEAVLCVVPSDQTIQDEAAFRRALEQAAEVARTGRIVTIGIVPERPETGYGYIETGDELGSGARVVERFVEKPDARTAEKYYESGLYWWNAGIFVFRAQDMLDAMARHLPDMAAPLEAIMQATPNTDEERRRVRDFFAGCQKVSIDYGVMEKEAALAVVPADFGWSDLGSWQSAWELSPKDEAGNAAPKGTVLVDCRDSLVVDSRKAEGGDDRVIAVVGARDLCVVETDDALLILPRERSQDVRQVVDELKRSGRGHKT